MLCSRHSFTCSLRRAPGERIAGAEGAPTRLVNVARQAWTHPTAHGKAREGRARTERAAMYIEEISIDGFKSYAKRVVVPSFDPYFNAITGLNGSGKSNILDSICFVLGITNLSQVRGVGGRPNWHGTNGSTKELRESEEVCSVLTGGFYTDLGA